MLPEKKRQLSNSQLGQDLWVSEMSRNKRNGYFVEVGAFDGIQLSNTYLLEKNFGWSGVCIEPHPKFYEQLTKYRTCKTSNLAVYSKSGQKLKFTLDNFLSGVTQHFNEPERDKDRFSKPIIEVSTITLTDLLDKMGAPKKIDYISIDTEGTEYEIIKAFDFSKYSVNLWTIEHNQDHRSDDYYEKIVALMKKNGYKEKKVDFDIWFWREMSSATIL